MAFRDVMRARGEEGEKKVKRSGLKGKKNPKAIFISRMGRGSCLRKRSYKSGGEKRERLPRSSDTTLIVFLVMIYHAD